MKKSSQGNRAHILTRFLIISVGIILFAVMIMWKLFNTTVIHAAEWNAKANTELSVTDTIPPVRGEILAADGSVLVTNLCYYNVRVDFGSEAFRRDTFLCYVGALSDSLGKYFPSRTSAEWHNALMTEFNREPGHRSRSYRLLKGISFAQLERFRTFPFFNQKNKYRSGLIEESYMRRDCPYGSMARRSIGRVGQTDRCREVHGISGLEKALDEQLYGTPGVYKRVPLTHQIANWTDIPAVEGYTVTTTIDIAMQDIVEAELEAILDSCGAEWGTAVLMDVATGDIKAISNLEYDRSSGRFIEAYNRALVPFEPGSVVKTISMLIALEDGLVNNVDSVMQIGGSYAYGGGRPISDSHYIGETTVAGVLEQSSNIGMTRIITNPRGAYHNDPTAFPRRLESIGFMEPLNTGISEEVPPRINRRPSRLDMSRMCFGYATAIPPIYTLTFYNAIANNGRLVRPRLVKGLSRNGIDSIVPVSYIRDRICSEENAGKLRYMLSQVVDGEHGTGRRLRNPYVKIAGKTGTCYDIDTISHTYNHALKRLAFCGFFPADAPRYSMMVLTYHPTRNLMGAASTSGEVLKNVALKMFARGMLGNQSDYTENNPENPRTPRLYVSNDNDAQPLSSALGENNRCSVRVPHPAPTDGMPDVRNFNLRRAVNTLEQAGYEVASFSGEGRVVNQRLTGNRRVELTLSNTY